MKADAAEDTRRILNADDAAEADRRLDATVVPYHTITSNLGNWIEANFPESPALFAIPAVHRRRLRTNERLE